MATMPTKQSEFADKHKQKSHANPRANRLHRRSLDWAQSRGDEVNRRRKIEKLSPLQESEASIKLQDDTYHGKTPIKRKDTTGPDNMKEKLKKWKEEKEKKKKLVALERAKNKPFIIKAHVEHDDGSLIRKGNSTGDKTKASNNKQNFLKPGTATTKKITGLEKSSHHNSKGHNKIAQQETTTAKKLVNSSKPPHSSSRVTRSAKSTLKQESSKSSVASVKPGNNMKNLENRSKTQKEKGSQKAVTKATSSRRLNLANANMEKGEHLAKVNTYRGDRLQSFAPEDYTFTAPSNLKSFVFNPLSPTSAGVFLKDSNPDETAHVSFLEQNPKRCSTPKRGKSRESATSSSEKNSSIICNHEESQTFNETETSMKNHASKTPQGDGVLSATVISGTSLASQSEDSSSKGTSNSIPYTACNNPAPHYACDSPAERNKRTTRSSRKSVLNKTNQDVDDSLIGQEKTESKDVNSERKTRGKAKRSRKSTFGVEECDEQDSATKKRRMSRRSVSIKNKGDLEISVKVSPDGKSLPSEHEGSTSTDANMMENRSHDNTIEDKCSVIATDDSKNNTDETPTTKKSRKSRKSVALPNLATFMEKEGSNLESSSKQSKTRKASVNTPDLSLNESVKKISGRKTRRSVAQPLSLDETSTDTSSAVGKEKTVLETESENLQINCEDKKMKVKAPSKAKSMVNADITSGDSNTDDEVFSIDKLSLKEKSADKSICNTPRLTRSARRSQILPAVTNDSPAETKTDDTGKEDPKIDKIMNEKNKPSPAARKKKARRTLSSNLEFRPPTDVIFHSAKRSTYKKRRKTEFEMRQLLKSPEEWIEVLSKSPMVEMTRKTPKQKSPQGKIPVMDLEMDLDDLELPPKDLIQDPEDIQKVIEANLSGDKSILEDLDIDKNEKLDVSEIDEAGEHDVKYFRKLLRRETKRLNNLSDKWLKVRDSTQGLSEEVQGQIRTVVGQAQLLIDQRFKQFTGLVDNCEFKLGEKETTCTDLQGFWDMIYYQVEDVDGKFIGLDKLKDNNFIIDEPKVEKKVIKKKVISKPVVKKAVKSSFAAFRAQMKKNKEEAAKSETKVMDFGFFKVSSPVKTPSPHCEAGSPKPKVAASKNADSTSKIALTVDTLDLPAPDMLRTPSRKSYVPVVPSPLLQDTTPQPRLTRSLTRSSIHGQVLEETKRKNLAGDEVSVLSPIASSKNIVETPGRAECKRKSVRGRKSVAFSENVVSMDTSPVVVETQSPMDTESQTNEDEGEEFLALKYLQSMESRQSIAPKDFCPLDHAQNDSFSSLTNNGISASEEKENNGNTRRRRSSLRQLPSQRRRSTRRSVSFCSPLPEANTSANLPVTPYSRVSRMEEEKETSDMFSPLTSNTDSDSDSGRFSSLNIAYTPKLAKRRSRNRPSLLYTPPTEGANESTAQSDVSSVPTGVLISFTP